MSESNASFAERSRGVPSRRDVLRGGALLAASACLPQIARALPFAPGLATRRVVLVVFGGGVRTRETLGSDNVPNLSRIAESGVVYPNTVTRNLGHYGAAASILTGSFEAYGIREDARPARPTLFEYVREETGLPASEVWLATSGTDQETNYAFSSDAGYGSAYGANLIGGEGLFNAEFEALVAGEAGVPTPDPEAEATLAELRGAMRTPLPVEGGGLVNDAEATARIESYILDELRGGASGITGLGADDAKAMHVARNLLAIFRPRLLTVTLRTPDVAHGSYNDYVTTIRRNDEELGRLFDAIQSDAELASSTALFVLPEFGRDRDFNERRGLDHGDSSDDLLKVATVAWGPDFRSGRVSSREIATIDVCPTIASLFGARTGRRTGTVLKDLFA